MKFAPILLAVLLTVVPGSMAAAAELNCGGGAANVEEFRYTWRLRGGLRWIAAMMFPTSGLGNLRTVYPGPEEDSIKSELLITSPTGRAGGFYAYESEMDESGEKTLMTYHGYAWGKKSRNERIVFDYAKRLARQRKETTEGVENKVKPFPNDRDDLRDVLTAIYYLRQHAGTIKRPITTAIYSDGKEYPVVFRPIGFQIFTIEKQRVTAVGFEIVDAPGGKKWPGGVKVWLSDDERRIPFRIEIHQSMAALQLDLQSIEACTFMQATGGREGR